jgi:flagellar motility protein MotE (MotC chaperone)
MVMDLEELDRLWERHPAWRLLRARNASLVLSFLGNHFIEENRGAVPAGHLAAALDDFLYAIHRVEPERYAQDPSVYIDDWSSPESGWLRRFYPAGSEEVHVEATPAIEKAYRWVEDLRARAFVGTESRLHTVLDLLRQIVRGSETDPEARVAELERRRDAIEAELANAREGRFAVLDDTALRERYQQFSSTARELLGDFREVEENFRALDRTAREKIAGWEGGKGDLLSDLVSSRTDIAASDQGRSFQGFYDFLLSEGRQDELAELLSAVIGMPQVGADRRLRAVHHDWADAAERTQQTVRNLSEQLRRFLEDQVWVENRRVMELARAVEASALAVRDAPPRGDDVSLVVDQPGLSIALPFERPLYDTQPDVVVDSLPAPQELGDAGLDGLFAQRFVDTARLADNIRAIVPPRSTASLEDIIGLYPVAEGIAEILGYLSLGDDDIAVEVAGGEATIEYHDVAGAPRRVRMPKVTVTRR